MSTAEQAYPKMPLNARLGRNPMFISKAAVAVNSNNEDKENAVPESAKCYLESIEYTCGHCLDLNPVTHTNCKGIPAGQSQCNNMATFPKLLTSRRQCRKCTALKAEEKKAADAAAGASMPSPAPTPRPATPPNNKRGGAAFSASSCDDATPCRPERVFKNDDTGADADDEEEETDREDWEEVSKKDLENMDVKDEEWVMA